MTLFVRERSAGRDVALPFGRATFIACVLVLCGGCTEAPRGDNELVFKHGKLAGDPGLIRDLLAEFERDHPGITVREEVLPASTDQQHQYYAINLESRHVSFDVFAIDVIWVQEFARAGWILDVDAVLPESDRRSYFPAAMEAASYEGRLYAVPWYLDVGVLFYRRDLLDRYGFDPPRTWSQLVSIVRRILDKEGDPTLMGFLWTGKQYEGLVCVALEFIWSRGGSLLELNVAGEQAVGFMRDLIERERVSPQVVALADEETVRLLFGNGRAVFMRNWPYAWKLLNDPRSPISGKSGMAALPAFEGHEPTSVLGGWMLAVPARSAHREVAIELARFLTGKQVQRRMAHSAGYHPARRDLYDDPALQAAQPWLANLYPVFLKARPRPVTPYYLMLSQVWQPELSAVVVGRKQPAEAFAAVRRQLRRMAIPDDTVETRGVSTEAPAL
jgi:multiple sugar transport system substrate-binding protein